MNQDQIFDELLILKCREGDTKAFELLVKRWSKKLIFFAYKFTNNIEAARDVTQESWISIHKGLRKLQEPSKFKSWAFRITHNKSIDYLRQQKKQELAEIEPVIEDDLDNDQWPTVNALLLNMPKQHKTVLTLFYLEQQSIRQIASILKLSEGTVKSRIFYAREHLKRKYKEVKL
ncbi:MAG TPA: RNA polymerase sigma factor [Fulvivirga sp.]|nr:RNA polymerase sigma factor [Fulvivirga sp.]